MVKSICAKKTSMMQIRSSCSVLVDDIRRCPLRRCQGKHKTFTQSLTTSRASLMSSDGSSSKRPNQHQNFASFCANIHALSEQVSSKESAATLTIIAERGYILAIPLTKGHFLAIQAIDSASLGKLRNTAQQYAERISALLNI